MLSRLRNLKTSIKVGIIGAGFIGKGLVHQCHLTPGIECVALADVNIDRAAACAGSIQREHGVVQNQDSLHDTIRQGKLAICEDGHLVASCDSIDVLIEASNSIRAGGQFSVTALSHNTHLILVNAACDLIFGPYLRTLAENNGVLYSSCDGDQPGVIKHLIDDVQIWGLDIVMAGNIKGFLDRYSNPTAIIPEADQRNLDYNMATAFTDGTKLNIEMALIANALGCTVLTPGMRGPRAKHVRDVFHLFDFDAIRERQQPIVDYILGAEPGGGVFVIGYCNNEYQRSMLSYYKMGDGPFYLFHRPYHLCHIEAMTCVAEAFLDGRSLLEPTHGFRTNVYAYAKRDLHPGDILDGIGGYACYGLIENCVEPDDHPGLPICLADDIRLQRGIGINEKIHFSDVIDQPDRADFVLYRKAKKRIA